MPNMAQWDWLRNFIVRGLRRTDLANFGYQDRRAILCSLERLDEFLNCRFGKRYDTSLISEAKLFTPQSAYTEVKGKYYKS
jgi:hypothetical protein